MHKKICIIIPIYKNAVNLQTQIALKHNLEKVGKIPCCFIAPKRLETKFYYNHFGSIPIIRFPNNFFKNTKTYNKLMLLPSFYKHFAEYQYICICQTDALILRDIDYLLELAQKDYDYWGAPWYPSHRIPLYKFKTKHKNLLLAKHQKKYVISVGNGGLSLRNVRKTIQLLRRHPLLRRIWNQNEDYFFAVIGGYFDSQYHIAPRHIAQKFSLETNMKEMIETDKIIPFGVHAWKKYYPQLLERTIANE